MQNASNFQKPIVNFFGHRLTSGKVYGMNSKIRLLKRIAFCMPNFKKNRLRMIWACG
ncbi:MAG: transposase [Ardenticatenaceae bacterium]